MQGTDEMRDRLVNEFAENYMEKLFYFCLKKTGNNAEAEDLTQDIAYQIIASLNKGTVPVSFNGWVWQIARNRYSTWSKRKHDRAESVTGSDIGDYEIADGDESVLDKMIHTEQMALLRRELAFIKSDYRDIVVAYYIEDKKVSVIASDLSLPVNTVKSRLLRAREILKEGMDMARTFGKRSYNPENIVFHASGRQPSGLPWTAVGRQIPKNILLEASNNPSTIEELSVELGIALPYMEEEVETLYNATLLAKQGDKYVTNFFIFDKESILDIYNTMRDSSEERSKLISELIEEKIGEIRSLGICGEHIDDNILRWLLIPRLVDLLILLVTDKNYCDPPKRTNGESWGFIGYEEVELPENVDMGHNGSGIKDCDMWKYDFADVDFGNHPYRLMEQDELALLCDCIRGGRKVDSFTGIEAKLWERIDGRYAHASADGVIIPDIIVMTEEKMNRIEKIFESGKTFGALLKIFTETYDKINKILSRNSNKLLHKSIAYHIGMEMFKIRMMTVHDLMDSEYIKAVDCASVGEYLVMK